MIRLGRLFQLPHLTGQQFFRLSHQHLSQQISHSGLLAIIRIQSSNCSQQFLRNICRTDPGQSMDGFITRLLRDARSYKYRQMNRRILDVVVGTFNQQKPAVVQPF